MNETYQSHELLSPYSSQMLSDHHLCDTNRITAVTHTGKDGHRSIKNNIKGKIDEVDVSNTSSLTSFSPFMSALELSPFLTSSESTLPTDYVWHEENIPRFGSIVSECQDTWNLNKHGGIILATDSEDDQNYMIPQFDGTSDLTSGSHQKSNQDHIPPIVSQHIDCLQSSRSPAEHRGSRSPAEHRSSRSHSEADGPLGMSRNAGTAGREMGHPEIHSPDSRTQQDISQEWPQQSYHWFQHQQKMPTLLPLSPAASFQSPTHNPHASPSQLQARRTPSPPQLQPQSPAYKSILISKSHQLPYQSPSQYPYQSPQSSWGFHSSHQTYKSPSASQSSQPSGETSDYYQSEPADKSYQSPTESQAQSSDLLYESPCSSHQSSQGQLYQAARNRVHLSTYQPPQPQDVFHSQRYPHPYHIPRHDASDLTRSVWGSHSYSAHNQGQKDAHHLKSCQNSCVTSASSLVKVQYSSNEIQAVTSDCDCSQTDLQDCLFPHDFGEKPAVNPVFSQSSATGVAHLSVKELKSNTTFQHSVISVHKQSSVKSSVGLVNNADSSKASKEEVGVPSSTLTSEQLLLEEPGQINIRRDKQTAFIKKIIDSPTPPVPRRRYRNRVQQSVELLGRSRSTSLSSPVSPMIEYHRCNPQLDVNLPVVGQPGISQAAPHPLTGESRMPSPMHSSEWQYWKEQNFLGCHWQEWKMHELQNLDNSENLSGSSIEPNTKTLLMGSRLQHTTSSVQSSIYKNNLQPNEMPLFTNTGDFLQNSLQIPSSSCHTSASKAKKGESASPSLQHLAPLVDSVDASQVSRLASSVPIYFPCRSDAKEMSHVLAVNSAVEGSTNVGTRSRQTSERASFDPAGKHSCSDLGVFSDLKPESISRYKSLDSIHFHVGEKDLKNKDLLETASPHVDTTDYGRKSSPAYTITFQVPTTGLKNASYFSCADSRTDNVEMVRMHPVDAHSNSLLKIGHEVVKAVKLSEVEVEGYVASELSPPDIIPPDGCADQLELDTSLVGVSEHCLDDREAADFLQNKAPGQNSGNTGQTSGHTVGASPALNCLSPLDLEWIHQNVDHNLANHKQEISISSFQSEDSHVEKLPCLNKVEGITSLHELSTDDKSRQIVSQLPGNYSGNLIHQLSPTPDSSSVLSVPSSIKEKYHLRQQDVYTSHVLHQQQRQRHHSHQHQQADLQQWLPHSQCSHPGLDTEVQPSDQHGPADRCHSGTVSDNTCGEDRQAHENTGGGSRVDIQANVACSSSYTAVKQHAARSTLKQPVIGHLLSVRHLSSSVYSTYMNSHTKHLSGIDQLDETNASDVSRPNQLEHSEDGSSSSLLAQSGCEDEIAHSKYSAKDVSEQSGQLSEFASHYGEQKRKLSSRKNVKALCLTIPKPLSHVNPLDLYGIQTCSAEADRSSAGSSHRDVDDIGSNHQGTSTVRRPRRCSRLDSVNSEAEGRHSPRKAKTQSAYSKNPHVLKLKKTRKTAGSLIEGVHYVVVGKFKGDQEMLVKTTKLNVTPTERVKVDEFEKLTAKEIVRVVSPSLLESRVYAGDSDAMTYSCGTSKSHSDMYPHNPHFESDNSNVDHAVPNTQSFLETNVEFSNVKDGFQPDRFRNRKESKNIFASFTKEKGEDNECGTRLKEDHFFFRFKESFIRHCKGKEPVSDLELQDHENMFFEGIKRSSFCNFQQKFLSNIQKLKSGDYSSSSDDEDDVLDETILKKRIVLSRRPINSPVESPQRPFKLGCATTEGNSWTGHPAVKDVVCTFSDEDNKINNYLCNPEKAENGQENKWSCDSKLGSYSVTDSGLDGRNKGRSYSEYLNRGTGWIGRFQEGVEADKHRQLLNECDGEKYIDSSLNMGNMNSPVEINMQQRNVYQQAYLENSVSDNTKDDEVKEDYLKCQMAFFEDISSDSESNDTIIMDTCMGKGYAFQRDTTSLYPSFSVTDKLPEIVNLSTHTSTLSTGSDELKFQTHIEHMHESCDVKQAEVCESVQKEAEVCATGSDHGCLSEIVDRCVSVPSSELTQVFTLTSRQKDTSVLDGNNFTPTEDILNISQGAFVEEQRFSTARGNSNTGVEPNKSQVTHPDGCVMLNVFTEPGSSTEYMLTKTHHKKKRHRKSVKKLKLVRASSATKGGRTHEDGNSSCLEMDACSQPVCQIKSLPERKKTYTYYTEDLDSNEDVSSDSSDEDFTVCPSRQKGLKINIKSKRRNPEDRSIRKLPKASVDSGRAGKRGQKASTSRGKKKKAPGGDKLLSSLSLLHMATLANLTETPSDLPDQQSVSEAAVYMQDDSHTLHYTDSSLSSAPDEMFPYSSQHSAEEDPPPVGSKRWKHSRKRKCARENTTLSKKLLKRQASFKYGQVVMSDIGRNQVSLSRLVNNFSSSPVPSNFTFNQISDASGQQEAANLCEDAGTNTTLQLLETRRAQVNCASFSMKDILKLTTPDDSMDSDSRDSSALVRFSASKKAQVKSTTLSMSDILKLTNVNNHSEEGQASATGLVLTHLPDADFPTSHPSHNSVDRLQLDMSLPSSLASVEAVVTSCAVQPAAADFVSTSHTPTGISELSGCFKPRLKQFKSYYHQSHSTDKEPSKTADTQKSGPEQRDNDSNAEPASCVLVEGTSSRMQVERKAHNQSVPDSDLVKLSTEETMRSPDGNVKTLDTSWYVGSLDSKHAEIDTGVKTGIKRLQESHKHIGTSSSSCAFSSSLSSSSSSSVPQGTVDVKSAFERVSTTSLNSVVSETHTTSFSTLSHSSHLILKTPSISQSHRDGEQEDSEKVVVSQKKEFTATTGTVSELTGVGSPSVSPLEECDQLNYDIVPTVPSHVVLEASIPGTSVLPVVKTARLSGASGRPFFSQKVSSSSTEPLSTVSKQENKGNHKSIHFRNTDRGVKPLHPLQIPHYSSVDQNFQSQVEQVLHTTKNSSLYYPHCWQWPVHTPGSDSTVSPLNLCTSHKSPNNYSPITPTSPISPDYPTQAQGVTEFDKSPRVKEGKPLWYPWLKVEPVRSETRVSNAQPSHYSSDEYKVQTTRNSDEYKVQTTRNSRQPDLLPVKQSEQEGVFHVFREPAQVESQKGKHDTKTTLDVQKHSPGKSKDQFNSACKPISVKPCGAVPSTESGPCPGTAIDASCVTGDESLPSTK